MQALAAWIVSYSSGDWLTACMAVFRADNRLSREIRPISFTLDTTPAADGSATCEMGLTVVQVSVYGPREPRRAGQAGTGSGGGPMTENEARVEVDCSVAGFVAGERRKRTKGDRRTVEMAAAIRNTFEPIIMAHLYPRSQLDIFVQVLSQDGGMLSAAINATTLALIHAGVSITTPLASLAVSALHDVALLDPSGTEESDLPTVTVACLSPSRLSGVSNADDIAQEDDPLDSRVTVVNMETRLSIDRFEGMLKLAVQGCKVLSQEMDDVVRAWATGMAQRATDGPKAFLAAAEQHMQTSNVDAMEVS